MGAPTGYPDWQRVQNWDGPALVNQATISVSPTVTSGIVDVSRYAAIAGVVFAASQLVLVTFTWYLDSGGTLQVGTVQIPLDSAIAQRKQIRIPNLGPYVKVQLSQLGGVAGTASAILFATNRAHPLQSIPPGPQLIRQNAVAINTGITATFTPEAYYAGPVRVHILTSGPLMTAILNALDQLGVYQLADQEVMVSNVLAFTTIVPLGAWQLQVQNTSGTNGSAWVHVTPTATGSS